MAAREQWSGRLGFILASMGAAIGLGNLWLFPWRLGSYGGAAFLIPYLIFVFGFVRYGLMAELAFGRAMQKGPIGACEAAVAPRFRRWGVFSGSIPVFAVSGILVFYSIVLGWILRYFVASILQGFSGAEAAGHFEALAGSVQSVPWHGVALLLCMGIVLLGISRGLELSNRIAMPLLFVLLILLMGRSLTLPGADEGIRYLLLPDWSRLLEVTTWVMALGQAFFTVSLGGMLIYGSYLSREIDIPESTSRVVLMNSLASLLAALVIMPSVFAFGLDPTSGPALLFVTMPHIFELMPGGRIFGSLFFFSVLLAGISSAINLLEVPVEALRDRTGMGRTKAVICVGLAAFALGIPLDLDMRLFGLWADLVTIYIFPLGALVQFVIFLWFYGSDRALEAINLGAIRPRGRGLQLFLKYGFVSISALVLLLGIFYRGIG